MVTYPLLSPLDGKLCTPSFLLLNHVNTEISALPCAILEANLVIYPVFLYLLKSSTRYFPPRFTSSRLIFFVMHRRNSGNPGTASACLYLLLVKGAACVIPSCLVRALPFLSIHGREGVGERERERGGGRRMREREGIDLSPSIPRATSLHITPACPVFLD